MTAGPGESSEARTLQDPLAESLRIVELANERGLLVRLMGGMAIRAHAPDWPARTRRVEVDLDFATRSKDRGAFYELLGGGGLHRRQAPQRAVRRQAGLLRRRRRASGPSTSWSTASRCATASSSPIGSRCRRPTLPLAELLLSKLQVVKINRKDVLDALVLLAEHPLGQNDGALDSRYGLGAINVPRILSFTSNDWGWWRTVTGNLDKLDQYLATDLTPEDLDLDNGRDVMFDPGEQVAALRSAIDEAPKSTRWKLRARVGERSSWYNEPEEMGHN